MPRVAAPRLALPLILLGLVLALLRGGLFLAHTPLLALANSFDQARYTGCFDLFPDRPATIRPDTNSPEAPFRWYAFQKNPLPLCYGSTELAFQAVTVLAYRTEAELTGATRFDVRWIGALRLAVLLGLAAMFCRAWWRRGLWLGALSNALALPLLLLDPANTLYFSTFYAEASALFALYALLNLVLLWRDDAPTARRVALLALAALALAFAKIQHLALPLALAGTLLVHGRLARGRWPWQGLALGAGALLGCALQFAQLDRSDPMMVSIRSYNRADVVFTALLPHVGDPAATVARLGLPAHCLDYSGKLAWQLPDLAEKVCPGIENVGRVAVVRELVREPATMMRLARASVGALRAWLAPNLGTVEGGIVAPLPDDVFTLARPLQSFAPLRLALLGMPLLAALIWLRRNDHLATLSVLVAALNLATLAVIVLGDGLADVPKQGHLIFNASLWWCFAVLLVLVVRRMQGGSSAAFSLRDIVNA